MDPSTVAATVTAALAPAMPYELAQGERLASEAAKSLGREVWKQVPELSGRLASELDRRPGAKDAANELTNNAADTHGQTALRFQLRKMFEADSHVTRRVNEDFSHAGW